MNMTAIPTTVLYGIERETLQTLIGTVSANPALGEASPNFYNLTRPVPMQAELIIQ
ncbi:MAG: hypothetical protein AAGI37_00785 [Planctomycetota bacterium]